MSYVHSGSVLFQKQRVLCAEHAQTKSAPKPLQNTLHGKLALESTETKRTSRVLASLAERPCGFDLGQNELNYNIRRTLSDSNAMQMGENTWRIDLISFICLRFFFTLFWMNWKNSSGGLEDEYETE